MTLPVNAVGRQPAATFGLMATVVFLHAHPDDECLTTGGTMARLAAEGHRVVLVTATDGARGEVPDGLLADGETLAGRRAGEVEASARALGVAALRLLGYPDSGMVGTDGNAAPGAFCNVAVDDAAARLAQLLQEEGADVLVAYDDHGGYGHPDHIQVHRVGVRAGELAGTPSVYEATIDRDRVVQMINAATEAAATAATAGGTPGPGMADIPDIGEDSEFGVRATDVTTRLDVGASVGPKREAMRCHRSQIADDTFWLTMPDEQFQAAFSEEQYIHRGVPGGSTETQFDLG